MNLCKVVPYYRRRDRTDSIPARTRIRPRDRAVSRLQTEHRGARKRPIQVFVGRQTGRTTVRPVRINRDLAQADWRTLANFRYESTSQGVPLLELLGRVH